MTWTKVDDRLHSHPKVLAAWHAYRPALGLHLLALSHSAAHLTDGHVSEVFVRTQLPSATERRRALAALLDAGLWERNDSGWVIHDYLDYNESRERVVARRSERSQSGRRGATTRWQSDGNSHTTANDKRMPPTRPTPDLFPSAS